MHTYCANELLEVLTNCLPHKFLICDTKSTVPVKKKKKKKKKRNKIKEKVIKKIEKNKKNWKVGILKI